jgi:tetratricopeptide (TPR) repeat protein
MSGSAGYFASLVIGLIVNLLLRRGRSPKAATAIAPTLRRSPVERRADEFQALLDRGLLDDAAKQGRAWIREIDTREGLFESVSAGCLASILEALVERLPETQETAAGFGEALLSTLNAKPAGGKIAKLRTLCALVVVADAAGDEAAERARTAAVVEFAETMEGVSPADRSAFHLRHAACCRACGDRDEAIRQLERASSLLNETSGNLKLQLEIFMMTGAVRFETGQIQEARAALDRAREVVDAAPELEDRFWIAVGMTFGQVLLAQNDSGALLALNRTVEAEERAFGREARELIPTLYHLARAHIEEGLLPDAAAALERALAIHAKVDGRGAASVREPVLLLARVKFKQGELQETRRLLTELLEAEERADPQNDGFIATDLVNLASICRSLGDSRAEREHLERALAIAERVSGLESATLMPILDRLGFAVWNSSDWEAARDVNRRLAALQRRHLGPDHPMLANTLLNQAIVTARCDEHEAAHTLMAEMLGVLETTPIRPPEIVERVVAHLQKFQGHPVHGGGYKNLLPRARALRGAGGLPVAQA